MDSTLNTKGDICQVIAKKNKIHKINFYFSDSKKERYVCIATRKRDSFFGGLDLVLEESYSNCLRCCRQK